MWIFLFVKYKIFNECREDGNKDQQNIRLWSSKKKHESEDLNNALIE